MKKTYLNQEGESLQLSWDNDKKILEVQLHTGEGTTAFDIRESTIKDLHLFLGKCLTKTEDDREDALWASREQHMRDNPERYESNSDWLSYRKKTYGK